MIRINLVAPCYARDNDPLKQPTPVWKEADIEIAPPCPARSGEQNGALAHFARPRMRGRRLPAVGAIVRRHLARTCPGRRRRAPHRADPAGAPGLRRLPWLDLAGRPRPGVVAGDTGRQAIGQSQRDHLARPPRQRDAAMAAFPEPGGSGLDRCQFEERFSE